MSCTTTPKAVLKRGCWSQSQTSRLLFSKEKIKLAEPLDSGAIENDITSYATIQGLLEDGRALLLEVVPTDDNSTGSIKGTVGNNEIDLGYGEGRQDFHVKTGTPYLNNFATFKAFKYGYLYAIQEDNSIRGIQEVISDEATGYVYPLSLNEVSPQAPKYINDGQNVNSIMLSITYDASQTFETVDYGLQFRQNALEQRKIGSITLETTYGEPLSITSDQIIRDGYGDDGDGFVELFINGSSSGSSYVVSDGQIVFNALAEEGNTYSASVDGNSPFWDQDYYGASESVSV